MVALCHPPEVIRNSDAIEGKDEVRETSLRNIEVRNQQYLNTSGSLSKVLPIDCNCYRSPADHRTIAEEPASGVTANTVQCPEKKPGCPPNPKNEYSAQLGEGLAKGCLLEGPEGWPGRLRRREQGNWSA